MAAAICSGDIKYFMEEVSRWYLDGRDLKQMFLEGIPKLFRDFAMFLTDSEVDLYSGIPKEILRNNLTLNLDMVRFGIRLSGEIFEWAKDSSHEKLVWEVFGVKFFEGLKV
jgi:hypothetical protein